MKNNDSYQKVLETLFFVRGRPNLFERLEDLFEHIIKPSVMLTLAEATAPDIAKGFGLVSDSAGRGGVPGDSKIPWGATGTWGMTVQPGSQELACIGGVKPIIAVPLLAKDRPAGSITVYQNQASDDQSLLSVFV